VSLAAADMEFARELLSDIPDLATRRMFGGMGIYSGDTIFALMMSDGRLMLKAAKGPFADKIGKAWRRGMDLYPQKRRTIGHALLDPADAYLDDPEEACALAREALDVLR